MYLARLYKGALALILLVGGVTGAWGQVTTASILGTIKDASGAAVVGAEITIQNVDTGATRVLKSDESGRYRASQLSLGNYEVKAGLAGFKTELRNGIVLTVGQEAVVDLLLQVGEVAETVTVTGAAPLLEATTASVSGLVDEKMMRELPLNSRSLEQFVFLVPTIEQHRNFTNPSVNSGRVSKISDAGMRSDQNVYLLDGTDIGASNGQTPGSTAGTLAGVETIREFQILTHNYSAEFGRNPGAVLNLITRGGSNELHGTLFEFVRNDIFDARNFFDRQIPPFRRNQFGAVLGGPIKKDQTFFMGSYEALRQRLGTTNISYVPDDNARQGILPSGPNGTPVNVGVSPLIQPYLNLFPRANGPNVGGGAATLVWPFSAQANEDYFMVRIDHRINSNHSLFGRYTFDNTGVTTPNTLPTFYYQQNSRNQYTTIGEAWVVSPKAVNDFRVAFNRSGFSESSPASVTIDPSLDFIPGKGPGDLSVSSTLSASASGAVSLFGPDANDPGAKRRNLYQALDNFTYVSGNHTLKFGGNFERMQTNDRAPSNGIGVYLFSSLAQLLAAQPFEFDGNSKTGINGWRLSLLGLYLQDDYKPTPKLTLNLVLSCVS